MSYTIEASSLSLNYPFLKSLPSRRDFYDFAKNYLEDWHGMTLERLEELASQTESAALNIINDMHSFHFRTWDSHSLYLNPDQYEYCPEKELWHPRRFKPPHLLQRRGVENTEGFRKLFTDFQDTYNPTQDKYLSILVELGSLSDMGIIREISKSISGSSMSYCKVERPAKSKELKHHLHILTLATPITVIPETVGKYKVQIKELGQEQYSNEPMLVNLYTFLLYLHKPYDARIFASGKNINNLYRLLLEDLLNYSPNKKRQSTPIRRWSLNIPLLGYNPSSEAA
ncbi:hypothetical protein [Deinococcus alpinitundrae]|uniref:hypothetical protein n=1 Tax=Deinococcus alpinitundrae TaxID=468913 RepID=UPI0013798DE9|nr:hypothetical protein [Deinococcus alpinitundrae]